jgi:hypothetical protein
LNLNETSVETAYKVITTGKLSYENDPDDRLEYEIALKGMYFDGRTSQFLLILPLFAFAGFRNRTRQEKAEILILCSTVIGSFFQDFVKMFNKIKPDVGSELKTCRHTN